MASTKASTGTGLQMAINTGTAAVVAYTGGLPTAVTGGTFVNLLEQIGSFQSETKGVFAPATNAQSVAGESIALLPEPVDVPAEFNYVPGDPGQEALLNGMNGISTSTPLGGVPLTKQFKLTLPLRVMANGTMQTIAEIRIFLAIATGGINEVINGVTTLKASFRTTGGYIRILGS